MGDHLESIPVGQTENHQQNAGFVLARVLYPARCGACNHNPKAVCLEQQGEDALESRVILYDERQVHRVGHESILH
jgi:hypothetical protein